MKKISLSAVLLFVLVTPFIMTYGLGPGETPYWLFGLIFGLLLAYLGLDLIKIKAKEKRNPPLTRRLGDSSFVAALPRLWRGGGSGQKFNLYLAADELKSVLLWLIIVLVIGAAFLAVVLVRHQTSPVYQVHDIVIQLESVIQFFLQGKNPYTSFYFGTPLEEWHYAETALNPALFHFVMMPWYFLFSLPFYFLSISFFGFFDGRLPLLFLFFFLLVLAWRLVKDNENRRLFLVLLAFNPATLGYFIEGRGDIFMFAFLFWSWYWLEKKHYSLAGIPLALAFATKQSSWPIFPFYLAFLWWKNQKKVKKTIKQLLPFGFVFGAITLPFFLWGPKAFLDSTIFYLAGSISHSYPIAGYGWGMVLHQRGLIGDLNAYYPFWLWQLLFCLPLAIGLLLWLRKSTTVERLIVCYGLFTFVFWYFSRYFNNSHLGYLSMVFVTAYFWPKSRF